MKYRTRTVLSLAGVALLACACGSTGVETTLLPEGPLDYLTVAEASEWRATSTHAEVVELVDRLAAGSSRIHVEEAGRTFEDRSLPLLVIADPPVTKPEDVGERLVVFAWAGIHSGEVCGKPASLMLARDLASRRGSPLLDNLVILLLPLLNADGNDRMDPGNRPGQAGPIEGMGTRPNAQGLNINRDFTKLETNEARALAGVLQRWDPILAMDLHTTNGTIHQYALTYDGPRHPSTDAGLRDYINEVMLPAISATMDAHGGIKTFPYGNLNRDRTEWNTYPAQPRYSTHYLGLRNVIGVLSEAYTHAPYEARVYATLDFMRHTFAYAGSHGEELRTLRGAAIARTIARATATEPGMVALRQRSQMRVAEEDFLGYSGRNWAERGEPMDLKVRRGDKSVATLEVDLPFAYLFSAESAAALETLRAHGIEVQSLSSDTLLELQVYTVDGLERAEREYEGHNLVQLEVSSNTLTRSLPAGTLVVQTGQALGSLAAHLLEPLAEDGLGAWNFFDDTLRVGGEFPVLRLSGATKLPLAD
ncbi:MAG: dipeptidyl-peptidase-4 [Planctomycetota bacterium]|jgi:dipeptidyl-peptidase-4